MYVVAKLEVKPCGFDCNGLDVGGEWKEKWWMAPWLLLMMMMDDGAVYREEGTGGRTDLIVGVKFRVLLGQIKFKY